MRKLFLTFVAVLLTTFSAYAVPSQGNLVKVQQPDGTVLTIRLIGDEYLHFNTTADGYSIVKNAEGFYVYAEKAADGQLMPTAQIAHDVALRPAAEQSFLQGVQKYLAPELSEQVAKEKTAEHGRRAMALQQHRAPNYDYTKFRGLVVLVEYNDRTFDREDYKDVITETINGENYTGYYDYRGTWVECTGSVRDYFRDNSMGLFEPVFDIVGPVTVDRSQYYAKASDRAAQLTLDVVNAIDSEVDFSLYDGDGDGTVDMMYFVFAGHGAHVGGNDSRLLWPHASQIYNPSTYQYVRKDGVYLGRYACSTELAGSENSRTIDGIGTICHEFTHVLGLPDFYDTDYEKGGGQSNDPGNWTLMSAGCYLNNSRTPAGYSLFERYAAGFAVPEVINAEGDFTMGPLNTTNTGYRINTENRREYFILENRQKTRWDSYLPYHGMLVFRVDSTNTSVWNNNTVNANPKHNYYELVRARGTKSTAGYDPFPGRGRITQLNNTTTPANLLTWDGKQTKWGLKDIAENTSDGTISFTIENTLILNQLELPDSVLLPVGVTRPVGVVAEPASAEFVLTFKSSDETVVTIDDEGVLTTVGAGRAVVSVESDNGLSAECPVIVEQWPVVDNLADFNELPDSTAAILNLHDAQVITAQRNEIYVRDASAAVLFYKTNFNLKDNDVLNGSVCALHRVENRMSQLQTIEGITLESEFAVSDGEEVEPIEVTIGDLSEKYYSQKIIVKTVPIERRVIEGVSTSVQPVVFDGDLFYRIYNRFALSGVRYPSTAKMKTKRFDVTGIFGTHAIPSSDLVIDEIYLLSTPAEIDWEDPDGISTVAADAAADAATVYDLQGRRVENPQKGVYIVGGRKVVVK